jgi:hypothetical protein
MVATAVAAMATSKITNAGRRTHSRQEIVES